MTKNIRESINLLENHLQYNLDEWTDYIVSNIDYLLREEGNEDDIGGKRVPDYIENEVREIIKGCLTTLFEQ